MRHVQHKKNTSTMKTFILSIFQGHELKQEKTVVVSSIEQLKFEKKSFWLESPYNKNNPKNWLGAKRIR